MNSQKRDFPEGSACKPCWELRYCPYGPLGEFFPLDSPDRDSSHIQKLYQEALENFRSGVLRTEEEIWSEIERLLYLDPTKWELLDQYDPSELECRVWGHCCPVFWSQSGATETKVPRRDGRYIPRDIMLKVVRRDNHICQICFKYVPDHEIEFDHVIPFSKGGPTTVDNLRLLCRECNRKKTNSLKELLE